VAAGRQALAATRSLALSRPVRGGPCEVFCPRGARWVWVARAPGNDAPRVGARAIQ